MRNPLIKEGMNLSIKLYLYVAVALIGASLVAGLFYYKSQVAEKQAEIATLQGDLDKAVTANQQLTANLNDVKNQVNTYVEQLNDMTTANNELTKNLQKAQAKLASHDLLKLRNSRHSELVLKTINKSVVKKQEEWANE